MVACRRCALLYKECRLSSLSKRCAECVRLGKKCEPDELTVNFSIINKAIEKLEREELETKVVQVAIAKQLRIS